MASRLQVKHPCLILASASQTRLTLLRSAGLIIEAQAAHIDEAAIKQAARHRGIGPSETALLLATRKAERVAGQADDDDALVIGADQILVCGESWFDKPSDLHIARNQLLALRGRSHSLCSAVALTRGGRVVWTHLERPCLTMRSFSDEMLDSYLSLEGEHVLSSVGAYRLEGLGIHLFDQVAGDTAAILGLPLLPLLHALRDQGVLLR